MSAQQKGPSSTGEREKGGKEESGGLEGGWEGERFQRFYRTPSNSNESEKLNNKLNGCDKNKEREQLQLFSGDEEQLKTKQKRLFGYTYEYTI